MFMLVCQKATAVRVKQVGSGEVRLETKWGPTSLLPIQKEQRIEAIVP